MVYSLLCARACGWVCLYDQCFSKIADNVWIRLNPSAYYVFLSGTLLVFFHHGKVYCFLVPQEQGRFVLTICVSVKLHCVNLQFIFKLILFFFPILFSLTSYLSSLDIITLFPFFNNLCICIHTSHCRLLF